MRTIIAGSRNVGTFNDIANAVSNCGWMPSVVLSGTARGIDRLGELWAIYHDIPIEKYPAKWKDDKGNFIKKAGYLRNVEMAENADALIAIWDSKSRGTQHMIRIAQDKGLRVYIQFV